MDHRNRLLAALTSVELERLQPQPRRGDTFTLTQEYLASMLS